MYNVVFYYDLRKLQSHISQAHISWYFFALFASADQNSCLVVLLDATFVIDIFTALGVGSVYIYIASLRK